MRLIKLIVASLLVFAMAAPALAAEIKVQGSTTVYPIMQSAVEGYMANHSDVNITVSGGGSSNGIKALLDNTCDIAMASRKMKKKEVKLAAERGVKAVEHVVALDAVLPIVNPSNPVTDLSIEQLKGIFTGKITNWKDVGGDDKKIVVISRDTSSGTYETWQKFVVGKKNRVTPRALLQASSGAVLQAVAKNPKAISYDGIGYVDKTVKALKVNGIAGTAATAKDMSYPISRELQVYTNGEPTGATGDFIKYLKSAEGQKHVAAQGFVTLN